MGFSGIQIKMTGPSRLPLVLFACSLALSACEDDVLSQGREDIGTIDSGALGPLPLTAGMTFSYRATLTFRDSSAPDEGQALYNLSFTIQSVDDRVGGAPSALSVTATGDNMLDQSWDDIRDFDVWVARLGPARRSDVIPGGATDVVLSAPPTFPERPQGMKPLPSPQTFFIDVREMDALRTAFNAAHVGRSPRVVEPESNGGRWLFAYEGPDPTAFYFDADKKRRSVRIEYDPRGFLVAMSEVVGAEASTDTPRANANLNLTAGP